MHIRVSSVKSGKKVYRYAQLVISVRRPSDGMPTTKVIHNLGRLTDQEIENWRIALEALRKGKPLVVATSTSASTLPLKPIANLRFLDLTVLLELWNKWTLGSIIEGLIPKGEALVAPADVIAALTLQRCVEPSPKSYAPQWFPRTALPELLHIEPQHFNNTRIHRVLEELDRVGDQLQHQLPQLYENRDGQFVALFLDVTDSWFVGHGASMAQRGKTKEGRFERKINIAMLCNEKGYPIKWEVIEGRRHDSKIMIDLFRQIAALNWVGKTPVVCDRAMGNTASIQKLLALDVHFLTALTRNEFSSYTNSIPYQKLLDFKLSSREMASDQDIAKVARLVELEGAKKIDETLFFWDLGFIENAEADVPSNPALPLSISEAHSHKTVQAMTMGRILRADLDEGRALSLVKAGKNYGLDKSKTSRLFGLTRLADDIQQTVLNGGAQCLSINDLVRVSKIEGEEAQREQFRQMIETIGPRPNGKKARGANPNPASRTTTPRKKLPLRAVLYFNPTMFVLKRLNAQETLDDINNFIKELNASLASPRSRREKESISNLVRQRLAKHRLIDTFELSINEKTMGTAVTRS